MESHILLNFGIVSEAMVVKTGVFLTIDCLVSSFVIYDWTFTSVWSWFLHLLFCVPILMRPITWKHAYFGPIRHDLVGILTVKEIIDGFVLEIANHGLEYCSNGGYIITCMD
jgi:hypothetical protein